MAREPDVTTYAILSFWAIPIVGVLNARALKEWRYRFRVPGL